MIELPGLEKKGKESKQKATRPNEKLIELKDIYKNSSRIWWKFDSAQSNPARFHFKRDRKTQKETWAYLLTLGDNLSQTKESLIKVLKQQQPVISH